jgi:cyclohexanecarboxylate-CoA ligase
VTATWVPARARHYRRAGGPWHVPTLDALCSLHGGELVDGDVRLEKSAVEAIVARVAGGLSEQGVRRGDAVAWQLPNGLVPALLYRACWRIGAVAVPILHTFGPQERTAALGQLEPKVVVEVEAASVSDPEALLTRFDGAPLGAGKLRVLGSDVAVVLFTSGSTGTPKGVLHTHRALSWKAGLMARVHGLGNTDAIFMPAPLAHVAGLLNGVLVPGASGMRSVLVRRFDPREALEIVQRERISFLAGPPTFFVAMTQLLEESPRIADTSSIRLVSSGGASVTPAFVETTARVFDCRVKRTYGSTEAPTVTTSTNSDPFEAARDTDGRAVGEVELLITDPQTRQPVGRGEAGELWVRGPELFAGYLDRTQTEAAIARGGWFCTGDLATLDGHGWLRIVGRLKDVIIRGGENISASEVEGALESHPAVRQAVAVGFPDPLMGERVAAFVVADSSFDLALCQEWFQTLGLARFKTPERVVQLDQLPLLGSGKPDRGALRKAALTL